jgi:NAD-dependent SIR2 family protein deacetylase
MGIEQAPSSIQEKILEATRLIRSAKHLTAFMGEGISVESSLWSRYDDHFDKARPNGAHEVLGAWEARSLLKTLITQNIDSVQ